MYLSYLSAVIETCYLEVVLNDLKYLEKSYEDLLKESKAKIYTLQDYRVAKIEENEVTCQRLINFIESSYSQLKELISFQNNLNNTDKYRYYNNLLEWFSYHLDMLDKIVNHQYSLCVKTIIKMY